MLQRITLRRALSWLSAVAIFTVSFGATEAAASEDDSDLLGDLGSPTLVLQKNKSLVLRGCTEMAYLKDELQKKTSNLIVCHGGKSDDAAWKAVAAAVDAAQTAGKQYVASLEVVGVPSTCDGGSPADAVTQAKKQVAVAERAKKSAENELAESKTAWNDAKAKLEKLLRQPSPAADIEAARKEVDRTKGVVEEKETMLAARKVALNDASAALDKAIRAEGELAVKQVRAMRDALERAMRAVEPEADFLNVLGSAEREQACVNLRGETLALRPADAATRAQTRNEEQEKANSRATARTTDVLRKSSALTSAVNSGSGLLETVGSPDHVVFSLMSALGADSKVVGTQVVMQLNLANLIEPRDENRLKLSPLVRNVFLRAALPLSATEGKPQTGAPAEGSSSSSASRFSMVLGGSLLDEADPRLASANGCYTAVYGYQAAPFKETEWEENKDLRAKLLDLCHREVARRNRLAWRFGTGFVTIAEKTKAEVFAGALVYAPTSALYFNALYQNIQVPSERHAFGGGLSLSYSLGGPDSGVNAWGRLGFDFSLLGTYDPDKASDSRFNWEARITPTLRARVLGNQFFTLGVGPRKIGSSDHYDVLATVALTADADVLVNGLLTPTGTTAGGASGQ